MGRTRDVHPLLEHMVISRVSWILGLLALICGQAQRALSFPGHSPTSQTGNTGKAKVTLRGGAGIFFLCGQFSFNWELE